MAHERERERERGKEPHYVCIHMKNIRSYVASELEDTWTARATWREDNGVKVGLRHRA